MRSIKLPSWTERLLGIDPRLVPPAVFRVDQRDVGYARFERSALGVTVTEYRTLKLAPSTFHRGPLGGPLRDPQAFQEQLGGLVGELGDAVTEASLVLPDGWLRLVFAQLNQIPSKTEARQDALSWKLRQLVPFRVEELRIRGMPVPSLSADDEGQRVLIGFGIELLFGQLESAFEAAGIRIGQISNSTLPLVSAVAPAGEAVIVVLVDSDGYSLLCAKDAPLLYRYKVIDAAMTAQLSGLVERELQLTRSYIDRKLPGLHAEKVLVAAPEDQLQFWVDRVGDCFATRAEAVGVATLGLQVLTSAAGASWHTAAPMLGASLQEVA